MRKKISRNNFKPGLAWFAGVALMASLATEARAQSSDALIEKLVEKGILTANEAKDLREEADNDYKSAFQTMTGMPDWVSGYKLYGSFRGRYEQFTAQNNASIERIRIRDRLLIGLTINMQDNMEAGFRLGSGDPQGTGSSTAGNPLSQSSTFTGNWSDKNIYIDTAYGKWTAVNNGTWQLAAIVGKMDNPFSFTWMVFDPDLTPEGAVLQGGYNINDKHSIAFTAGAFVMDEVKSTTHDPFMYGGQVLWNAKWTPKWSSTVGLGAFQIVNSEQLTAGGNVFAINQGNTRQLLGQVVSGDSTNLALTQVTYPVAHFTPIIADASVTWTLDSFPLYAGAFPVKFTGEFMENAGASYNNIGYWVGASLGKASGKKTWEISYRYEYLEADAWYDELVDDDNVAYYNSTIYPSGTVANPSMSKGWVGGTNVKGHLIRFTYMLSDSLSFVATCYINSLINLPQQPPITTIGTKPVDLNSASVHFMADLVWKF